MGMHGVVVLHPAIDESKSRSGIRDWADPDIVALEGLHESLGHAVALRAFDRGEARDQVERHGDLDGFMRGEDRVIVGKPLYGMRRVDRAEVPLDAVDHHVADHLAGDAGGGCDPGDRFAIMAIEGEGNADDLAVPAGELQHIRAPAAIRANRRQLAVVLAHPPASGLKFEQEALGDASDYVPLLGKKRLDPTDYRSHAGGAAQITVDDDPVFGGDFGDRRGQPFEERMAVADITGQYAAAGTGADRFQMHEHRRGAQRHGLSRLFYLPLDPARG